MFISRKLKDYNLSPYGKKVSSETSPKRIHSFPSYQLSEARLSVNKLTYSSIFQNLDFGYLNIFKWLATILDIENCLESIVSFLGSSNT